MPNYTRKVNDQAETIRLSLLEGFEEMALENGRIARFNIHEILEKSRATVSTHVTRQLELLHDEALKRNVEVRGRNSYLNLQG